MAQLFSRLGRGKKTKQNAAKYIQSVHERIVLKSAATAWAEGVPWGTAVSIAERAISAASAGGVRKLPKKCIAKQSKSKAKAKPKTKR